MVKKEIRIYIEGVERGIEAARMREGFRKFLDQLYQLAQQNGFRFHPPVLCGSGQNAYKEFKVALKRNKGAVNFLLVDSEGPVADGASPWAHLNCDSFGLDDSHCHLMAQAMEAWLVADPKALKDFYEKDFNEKALPANPQVEQIPKKDLFDGLHNATAKTKKGKYHKTRHAPEILKRLDVDRVCKAAPYCERLFKTLTATMS
jgi:hypothetical protein